MPDEPEDIGNSAVIEGGEEIMSAIDGLFEGAETEQQGAETQKTDATPEQFEQQQGQETAEQTAERQRNEKGQFTKEQQAAKDKAEAEKVAKKPEEKAPEFKTKGARENWENLEKRKADAERRAESAESKLRQYETRIQELESKSGTAAPEVKVLQEKNNEITAKLEEANRILAFKAIEETDAFKQGVTQPQDEALAEINQAATTYKLDGRKIDEIMREPNKYKRREMLAELTEELPERSRFVADDLRANIEKYVTAEEKAKQLFANAKGNREFADLERQKNEAKAALERQKEYKQANEDVDGILKEKFPEIAGDEQAWKEITEKAFKVADFDKLPAKAKAFANMASWMLMPLMKKLRDEQAAHKATKEVLAKRNGATPSPTGGRTGVAKKGGDDDDKDIFAVLDEEFQDA